MEMLIYFDYEFGQIIATSISLSQINFSFNWIDTHSIELYSLSSRKANFDIVRKVIWEWCKSRVTKNLIKWKLKNTRSTKSKNNVTNTNK